jgi:hypothetical protein
MLAPGGIQAIRQHTHMYQSEGCTKHLPYAHHTKAVGCAALLLIMSNATEVSVDGTMFCPGRPYSPKYNRTRPRHQASNTHHVQRDTLPYKRCTVCILCALYQIMRPMQHSHDCCGLRHHERNIQKKKIHKPSANNTKRDTYGTQEKPRCLAMSMGCCCPGSISNVQC